MIVALFRGEIRTDERKWSILYILSEWKSAFHFDVILCWMEGSKWGLSLPCIVLWGLSQSVLLVRWYWKPKVKEEKIKRKKTMTLCVIIWVKISARHPVMLCYWKGAYEGWIVFTSIRFISVLLYVYIHALSLIWFWAMNFYVLLSPSANCSYQWIKRRGRPAPREIAPIIVSNHVSYIEPIFYFYELFATIVASESHDSIPFVGTIIRAMQVISFHGNTLCFLS